MCAITFLYYFPFIDLLLNTSVLFVPKKDLVTVAPSEERKVQVSREARFILTISVVHSRLTSYFRLIRRNIRPACVHVVT